MVKKPTNLYALLGLKPEVSFSEIKKAYRRLAKKNHPDFGYSGQTAKQRDRATEFMMHLNHAYETLADKNKRAEYDSLIGANGHGTARTRSGQFLPMLMKAKSVSSSCAKFFIRLVIPSCG